MKTCGNCKHWGKDNDAAEKYRACRAVIHDENRYTGDNGDDYLADLDGSEWEEKMKREVLAIRNHKAVVVDGSGYFAALKVREDFGCVLHEDK